MNLKQTTFALIASFAAVCLQGVEGSSPFIIADDRIRSLDHSPVLGRGYSIMTNTFQSTCLIVEQTTVPSFNYDCKCYRNVSIKVPCITYREAARNERV